MFETQPNYQGLPSPTPDVYQMPEGGVNDLSLTPEQKRQLMAKLLQGQNKQEDKNTQYTDGWAVKQSPWAGLSGAVGTLASAYMGGGAANG